MKDFILVFIIKIIENYQPKLVIALKFGIALKRLNSKSFVLRLKHPVKIPII